MGEIARFLWELQGFQIIVEKITEVQCHWKKHIFNLPVIFSLIGTLVPLSKPFWIFLFQFGIKIMLKK